MNHEPECLVFGRDPDDMCFCESLRAAYQRGREDAAKAVEDAVERYGWLEDVESVLVVFGFRAISAARVGEQ